MLSGAKHLLRAYEETLRCAQGDMAWQHTRERLMVPTPRRPVVGAHTVRTTLPGRLRRHHPSSDATIATYVVSPAGSICYCKNGRMHQGV